MKAPCGCAVEDFKGSRRVKHAEACTVQAERAEAREQALEAMTKLPAGNVAASAKAAKKG